LGDCDGDGASNKDEYRYFGKDAYLDVATDPNQTAPPLGENLTLLRPNDGAYDLVVPDVTPATNYRVRVQSYTDRGHPGLWSRIRYIGA